MPFQLQHHLLSALLGAVFGYGLKLCGDALRRIYFKDRLLRTAWGFLEEPTYIFLSPPQGEHAHPITAYGDWFATTKVIGLKNRLYPSGRQLDLRMGAEHFDPFKKNHLVVIGGGKYNEVYRELVDTLRLPLHFFDTPTESFTEIRNHDRSIVYSPAYDGDGNVTHDIGLLVHVKNPYDDNKWIILAAGSHTYGTIAAIEALLQSSTIRELKKYFRANFEVVVRGDVTKYTVENIHLISKILTF